MRCASGRSGEEGDPSDPLTPFIDQRGLDWGAAFMKCLQEFGMPGPDFVLFDPKSLDSFSGLVFMTRVLDSFFWTRVSGHAF